MATLEVTHPTMLDVIRRTAPDGKIDQVAEFLSLMNPMIEDMPMKEGNLPTGHRSTIRTGLPTVTWRKLNGGVVPSKSRTAQIDHSCGMLEAYAEVDKALAELNGNSAAWRWSEDKAFVESMAQEHASTLVYGNEGTEPEAFTGFAAHYNDQSAENACNILTSAATPDSTDNTSIWLIAWGDEIHGIYPKGSTTAGIQVSDLGEHTLGDSTNGLYQGYRTHYKLNTGLRIGDWRYAVRINFDLEDVISSAATGPDLPDLMAQATDIIPSLAGRKPVFYANRSAMSKIRQQIEYKSRNTAKWEDVGGRPVMQYLGIPVRRCDAIQSTESGL